MLVYQQGRAMLFELLIHVENEAKSADTFEAHPLEILKPMDGRDVGSVDHKGEGNEDDDRRRDKR